MLFAYGILLGKVLPDKTLVDNHNGPCLVSVHETKKAATDQWHMHSAKVVADDELLCGSGDIRGIYSHPLNQEVATHGVSRKRQVSDETNRLDARQIPGTLNDLIQVVYFALRFGIPAGRNRDVHGQYVIWIKAFVHMCQADETAQEQASARKQNQRLAMAQCKQMRCQNWRHGRLPA